jgi:steroid delta-isomerase-like uncharacterized protein
MSEKIKAIQRHLFEEMSKGKEAWMKVMDELYATNFVIHQSNGQETRGLKNYKQYVSELISAIPDFHFTLDDVVAEGNKVAVHFTATGTHKGNYMGVPPTNKKVTMWVISIDQIADGKIAERWERTDTLGMMQQLGVVPTPKK